MPWQLSWIIPLTCATHRSGCWTVLAIFTEESPSFHPCTTECLHCQKLSASLPADLRALIMAFTPRDDAS